MSKKKKQTEGEVKERRQRQELKTCRGGNRRVEICWQDLKCEREEEKTEFLVQYLSEKEEAEADKRWREGGSGGGEDGGQREERHDVFWA